MGFWRNGKFRLLLGVILLGFFVLGTLEVVNSVFPQRQAYAKSQAQRTPQETSINGEDDNIKPKAVLILINGILLEEYSAANTPNIYGLMQKGSTALMNTRPAGARNTPNAYATIGAGIHVVSSGFAGDAFNSTDTDGISASVSYTARTGMEAPPEGVVTLGIPQIRKANEAENIEDGPGRLGEALHSAGLKTAVLGNGDIEDEFNRDAVTIVMDKWGKVDYGDVSSNLLIKVPESPLGYQTDFNQLFTKFTEMYDKADLIVIETGDTFRAEELADAAFPEIMEVEKHSALAKADVFVGRVINSLDLENTLVMIASPHPSKVGLKNNNYMTPLIVYGGGQGGGFDAGFLTSGTTRRQGVVANTDICPTILEHLGVEIPPGTEGRAMKSIPVDTITKDNGQRVDTEATVIGNLTQMNSDMVFIYNARPVLVKGYVGLIIVVMVLVIGIMVLWPHFLRYLRPGLLWLMAVPISLLLIAAVRFVSLPLYTLIAIVVAALVVLGAYAFGGTRDVDLFIVIGMLTAVALLADVATGSALIKNSTLGYDPMSGSRYYGIGNEYMGVLLGAAIIAISALWEKYYKAQNKWLEPFTLAFFGVIIVVMAAPQLGTNVGGTIAALAAFTFTYLQLKGVKISIKRLVLIGGGVVFVIVALAIFDMNRDVEVQSHLGRFATNISSGGLPIMVEMFSRKIQMNIKLIRYTIWSRVFLVMLVVLMVSFYRPVGLMGKVRSSYPYVFKGLLGILVGAFVALVVNDSGIVVAATMMIFGMAPLIYLMGKEREQDANRASKKKRKRPRLI